MIEKNRLNSSHILSRFVFLAGIVTLVFLYPESIFGQTPAQGYSAFNHDGDSVGIHGFDPVSYFNGKPAEGEPSISFTYHGVIYRFVNEANRQKFSESPVKYEPQYGGWCAFAMGEKGEKVDINPLTYKISDGKLYLFYNKYFTNTLNSWNKNEPELKHSADQNWEKILNQR